MFPRLTLAAKLLGAFAIVLALLLFTVGMALWQLRKSANVAEYITSNCLASVDSLGSMGIAANSSRRVAYGSLHTKDQKLLQSYVKRIATYGERFGSAFAIYTALPMNSEERELVEQVGADWKIYTATEAQTIALSLAEKPDEAFINLASTREAFNRIDASITRLMDINVKEAAEAKSNQDVVVRNAYVFTVVTAAIAMLVGISLALIVARRITTPVLAVRDALHALAAGDLTKRVAVDSQDEIAEMATTLNSTMDGLRDTVATISRDTHSIASAAEELSAVSRQLTNSAETASAQSGSAAASATEIAQSIDTVAAGIEEMGASVSEISKNAGQAANVAKDGVNAAEVAKEAMSRLGKSSTEIGAIVNLITGIAEQTNLLALNATIEAARAGDSGRGFAVVASEVKELARKTGLATGDIAKRVGGIQTESVAAHDSLLRIRDIVGRISDLQQSIASAVEEQSATTKEFSGNINQVALAGSSIAGSTTAVADAARQTSTGASETRQAATELARLAEGLRLAVARFRC